MINWQPIFAITCLIFCATNPSVVKADNERLANKLTHMIRTTLADATIGVVVQDANSGKIVYEYHGAKNFTPASTTKLFTSAAALKELGPDFVYETGLYYDATSGQVAIKFSGDPTLKLAHLRSLINELRRQTKVINGDLWIDDSLYQGPLLGQGWTWDSTSWYHAAPVSAIIIDRNQFGINLFSTAAPGDKVEVKLDQPYPGAPLRSLKSNVVAATVEDAESICQISAEVDEDNNAKLTGCWPIANEPAHLRLAIKNPRANAKRLILESLKTYNITLKGQVRFAKAPEHLTKIAHHNSEPLRVLLNAILAESNNLYAETVGKTLGAHKFNVGSFKTSTLAIENILVDMTGIDFDQARLLDASGESRYNLLTPLQLARLLYIVNQDKEIREPFRAALASSGISGTLQRRFTSFDTKSHIQAKTGSLNGVSALAGYLTARSNRELIVTIMINGAMDDSSDLKNFENRLCYFLVNQL